MGPRRILQCYKNDTSFSDAYKYLTDHGIYEGFITKPLEEVLSDRGDETLRDFSGIILDTIHGKDDLCMSIFLENLRGYSMQNLFLGSKCSTVDLIFNGIYLVNHTGE